MAKKYIDVNNLLLNLPNEPYKGVLKRILIQAPAADVVEVVRCGECEWWTKQEASCQGRCERYGIYPTAAWYCAAGTKMEGEGE